MTEEQPAREDVAAGPGPHDVLLESWVSVVEAVGLGIPVSLTLPGMMVSGDIIKMSDYIRAFAEDFRDGLSNAGHHELAQEMHAMFTRQADELDQEIREKKEREQAEQTVDEPRPFNFIHLRNANIFLAGNTEPLRAKYWRGRLSAVAGWILGKADTRPPT